MSLDDHITDVVRTAVADALDGHSTVVPLTYTVDDAAEALGCSPTKVRDLIAEGVLGTVPHMGTRRLIPRQDVMALVSAGASESGGRTTTPPVSDGPAESEPSLATVAEMPPRPGAGGGPTFDEPPGAA